MQQTGKMLQLGKTKNNGALKLLGSLHQRRTQTSSMQRGAVTVPRVTNRKLRDPSVEHREFIGDQADINRLGKQDLGWGHRAGCSEAGWSVQHGELETRRGRPRGDV